MSKILIAVYGSLKEGYHNHRVIQNPNTEKLGTFNTEPIYSLYSLGSYPGLKKNGNTSIEMEVYLVSPETAKRVDYLEGYDENSNHNDFYNREIINTPFGEARVYFYVPNCSHRTLVENGKW